MFFNFGNHYLQNVGPVDGAEFPSSATGDFHGFPSQAETARRPLTKEEEEEWIASLKDSDCELCDYMNDEDGESPPFADGEPGDDSVKPGFIGTKLLQDTRENISLVWDASKEIVRESTQMLAEVYQGGKETICDSGRQLLRRTRGAMPSPAICANLTLMNLLTNVRAGGPSTSHSVTKIVT